MFRNSFVAIGTAARTLLRSFGALALFHALYAALLVALYLFISTKEATIWQLTLTALAATAAPILFFILQAAGVSYAGIAPRFAPLLVSALKKFWKLLLVSLPLVALAVLVVYLLNKLQARFPLTTATEAAQSAFTPSSSATAAAPPVPLRWQNILFPALRLLLLGFALPLVTIQLWIAVAHEGFGATLRRLHRVVARAYAAQSVVIYTIGIFAFGLIPYLLIFKRTPVTNAWGELILFGLRLALAFVFTLWGWLITLGALTKTFFPAETGSLETSGARAQATSID